MADIAKISVNGTEYDIKDQKAQEGVAQHSVDIDLINGTLSDLISPIKNMLPEEYDNGDEFTANGVTFTKQEDGTVLATGTVTGDQVRYYWIRDAVLDPGTYVVSGIPEGATAPNKDFCLTVIISGTNKYFLQTGTFTVAEGDTVTIRAQYITGFTANHVWALMLEKGTTAHDYVAPGKTTGGIVNTVNENTQRIEQLETNKADKVEPLPSYWQEYLTAKMPAIQAERMAIGNHGDYFSFFTDYHTPWSAGYTAEILTFLKEKCHIHKHVFGGDMINVTTNAEAKEQMQQFADEFASLGLLAALGNHEVELYDTDINPTESEVYALLFKHLEERANVTLEPDLYYVYDNAPQKIRYIVLNTHNAAYRNFIADSEQINWLYQKMIELDEGWHIVVVMHMYYGGVDRETDVHSTSPDGALVRDMMDALNNRSTYSYGSTYAFDFANAKATAIALLSGHTHRDHAETSATGFPLIATNCDAVMGSGQNLERSKGDPTEHAIDLFFIDTAARTIKAVRIGAGEDRLFTY